MTTTTQPRAVVPDDERARWVSLVAVRGVIRAHTRVSTVAGEVVSLLSESDWWETGASKKLLASMRSAVRACIDEAARLPLNLVPQHRDGVLLILDSVAALEELRAVLLVVARLDDQERSTLHPHIQNSVLPRLINEDTQNFLLSLQSDLDRFEGLLGDQDPHAVAAAQLIDSWVDEGLVKTSSWGGIATQPPEKGADSAPVPGTDSQEARRTPDGAEESLDDILVELNALVGLSSVKDRIQNLTNLLRVQSMRQALDLKTTSISLHMVFVGSPGTGKTTVARLVGRLFRAMGLLSSGHLVEVARDDLVAGFVGQTALKTAEVVDRAIGGVLFIDEAYSLAPSTANGDFGREAIDSILKRMEDNRSDLVVVVAGYQDEMERFLSSNPGLRSRFADTVVFPDYSPDDMVAILELYSQGSGYQLSDDSRSRAQAAFEEAWSQRDRSFGNARLVRNYFEDSLVLHANRLASVAAPDALTLSLLIAEDLPEVAE